MFNKYFNYKKHKTDFKNGSIKNSFDDDIFYNIKRMQRLKAKWKKK